MNEELIARLRDAIYHDPERLDTKGRCCGRKPVPYKRPAYLIAGPHSFCPRCCRAFSPEGEQIDNWAWQKFGGKFASVLSILQPRSIGRTSMTPQDRQQIRDRRAAITPPPWAIDPGSNGQDLIAYTKNDGKPWTVRAYIADLQLKSSNPADRTFIAHAPSDIDALDAALIAAEAEIARLRKALKPFAAMADGLIGEDDYALQHVAGRCKHQAEFGDLRRAAAALEGER